MKILFLHGKESGPGGTKPTYLAEHGFTVINPALPADDFDASVRIAQAAFDEHTPDVVVGSSRGGAVAMNINIGDAGLVLLAPAWKKWGTAKTVEPQTRVIHSRQDDIVLFASSEELVASSPSTVLVEIGTDHRLSTAEPLAAMLEAVRAVFRKKEIGALDLLLRDVENLKSRESIVALCKLAVRFRKLAPFNAMLIYMQRPDATTVLRAEQWRELKRFPKASARPVVILAAFGPVEFVYDKADTEGDEVPEQLNLGNLGGNAFGVDGRLSGEQLARFYEQCGKFGVFVEEHSEKVQRAGQCSRMEKDLFEIRLNIDHRTEQKFATLCHELAHIFCGHIGPVKGVADDRRWRTYGAMETEAELTSYLVASRFGIEPHSGDYLKWFTVGGNVPEFSLETVLVATGKVESLLRGTLRKPKEKPASIRPKIIHP